MTIKILKNNVRKNYDLIAEQYGKDFGTYIEDLDFMKNLKNIC